MAAAQQRKATFKVDCLKAIEVTTQQAWEDDRTHLADAPMTPKASNEEKFFVTFPFPYMNGRLHLGHAFSLSKAEFAVRFYRLKGRRVLWPFGFHCTGMPIKACADKLAREMEDFGYPPKFPDAADTPAVVEEASTISLDKSKGKKSKAVAKTGGAKYQWQIMQSLGLKDEEIKKFADAQYWLDYFPPLAMEDLKRTGIHVDWRRTFITTDANPYFDSFVRWQFKHLKERGKVMYGKRYTIYSPRDGQPCMDHDRSTGEGVGPLEYTLIKMKFKVKPPKLTAFKGDVFAVAATLRPETMYGQTNCWLHPKAKYIAWVSSRNNEAWISTPRAARNMAYQGFVISDGVVTVVAEYTGEELLGLPLESPLAINEVIYSLPMLTVMENKGTGIVTSVPSDSPDDYAALKDLQGKEAFRRKYKIADNMIMTYDPIPIIDVPTLGNMCAKTVCEDMNIVSQNDKDLLLKAKELCYLKGFYDGVLLVGEHAGRKVQDVKKLIQKQLVDEKKAEIYYEPEKQIVSRSGEECVVALCNQWYINYGEEEWKAQAVRMLSKMETFHDEARNNFEGCLDWLHEYACSRTYGLGTKLPWDEKWLIESLSDSTIYMAFYTVVHFLQRGKFRGDFESPSHIKPELMVPEVWDYIFFNDAPFPERTTIARDTLKAMRREFEYWYPMDLRVSGKDLIQNHLTFMLYNHAAIWPDDESKWPLGVRVNGHLLLNSSKMSKSDGNFLTLQEAIETYSADGMRLCLADAGDSIEDANFVESTAEAGIKRLYTFIEWVKEIINTRLALRTGPATDSNDDIFRSEVNQKIRETEENYRNMNFKEALRTGFYEFQLIRDRYRELCGSLGMHVDLVMHFIRTQALMLAPICPHVAEHIWTALGETRSIFYAEFPVAGPVNQRMLHCAQYLMDTAHSFRISWKSWLQKTNPKGVPPNVGTIYIATTYPPWQAKVVAGLTELNKEGGGKLPENKVIAVYMQDQPGLRRYMKRVMPFVQMLRERIEANNGDISILSQALPFDERHLLTEYDCYFMSTLRLETLEVINTNDRRTPDHIRDEVRPGSPYIMFRRALFKNVELNNPVERSGLFTITTVILEGDTVDSFKRRIRRIVDWALDTKHLRILFHEDPVLGDRTIPPFGNYMQGRADIDDVFFQLALRNADRRNSDWVPNALLYVIS